MRKRSSKNLQFAHNSNFCAANFECSKFIYQRFFATKRSLKNNALLIGAEKLLVLTYNLFPIIKSVRIHIYKLMFASFLKEEKEGKKID